VRIRGRRAVLAVVASLLSTALAASCRSGGPAPADSAVIVVIDTLRADRLGCYGRRPSVTPAIDAFRSDAVLFEQAIAQAPSTLASVASMLTSLIPHHHGASAAEDKAVGKDHVTLAEVARAYGFSTAAFVGGGQLDAAFGLSQGFETYETMATDGQGFNDLFAPTVANGLAWLETHRRERFLLLLHTYEAHHPYTPSPEDLAAVAPAPYEGPLPPHISIDMLSGINSGQTPLADADLRHVVHTYEAEIRSVDAAFGELVAGLRRLGLDEGTMLVFVSDHGEEFGEHGKVGWHGHTLYDELLRIPLLVRYPGSWRGGSSFDAQVRGIDIAPTVLAGLGLPVPESFQGTDLGIALRGGQPPPPYAISALDGSGGGTSLRSSEWKWDRRALYHLSDDPGETRNVAGEFRGVAEKLRRIKQELVVEAAPAEPEAADVSPELRERLRSLGYVP